MTNSVVSERDVEVKIITPLFRDILGYQDSEMHWAVPVDMNLGREVRKKEADLLIKRQSEALIVVEAKKPTEAVFGATGQTDSYAFALQTPFSFITNGREFVLRAYYHGNKRVDLLSGPVGKLNKRSFSKLAKLIGADQIASTLQDSATESRTPDVEKIKDYRRFFKSLHSAIRDGDKLDPAAAFDELSKMLLMSAADEFLLAKNPKHKRLTSADVDSWAATSVEKAKRSVKVHFEEVVRAAFPLLSEETSEIELSPSTTSELLKKLEPFSVRSDDIDLKGRAFEEFLPSQLRGKGLGQYFTPRPIVDFMCELADISLNDTVLDFACGSGGFLIKAYEKMRGEVDILPPGTIKRLGATRESLIEDIKSSQIFGIDAEPRAARTARMNMLLWGDGRCVVRGNALAETDYSGTQYPVSDYSADEPESGCSLILANPPFGAREKEKEVLSEYVFGSQKKTRKSQKTEVLFVEKALRLLRPEGRLLIVLPTGLLSADSYSGLRSHILERARIRAIVNLPTHTFVQSGVPTVNTVVLYLQKHSEEVAKKFQDNGGVSDAAEFQEIVSKCPELDFEIFMADCEDVGFEPNGKITKKPGEKTDLEMIANDFLSESHDDLAELDIFDYAERLYGTKSLRRREQTVRGSVKDRKISFVKRASELADRMDPSYYIFIKKIAELSDQMEPLGQRVQSVSNRFLPDTDAELDAEYPLLSVSSDGKVTIREVVRGEDISTPQKLVEEGNIVYNPMRANIGSIGLIGEAVAGGLVSPDYHVIEVNDLDAEYLIGLLRTPFYKLYIDIITTGSIRDRLYPKDLQRILVPKSKRQQQTAIKQLQGKIDEEYVRSSEALVGHVRGLNEMVRTMLEK
ncbi:N-6 DNA methylase [Tritonibacter mobilis]|uniref:N-6 DNA methylase n=1 Tax=Tritonibacter mobilis TaxID=379347 RepID=UPI001CDA3C98|nr:N-6 DNA methylase [Tritonibacter mobilis]MCA2008510.1 N-6 DNA methylase [Tritonibacter mobilis]